MTSSPASKTLPGIFVKTFGCQMNEYDSEKVMLLFAEDYQRADSIEDAKFVFINTCSVRAKAEQKLFSHLGRLRKLKKSKPELIIGVGGCVAQQEGERIISKNSAVDFVVGTHNLSLIPSLVKAAEEGRKRQVAVDYRDEWEDLPDAFAPAAPPESDTGLPTHARALVAIQRGCNKACSFCVVPHTRGPEVSRSAEEIEREIRLKVRLGAKEVLLLGQTVNSYGRDLNPRLRFNDLLRRLAAVDGLQRIRFTSPHPQDVAPGFAELYGELKELMPHIHLPLQSGSDRILKLMNRNYRLSRYMEIIEALKKHCPKIAISTDIIVGFPTETEEDFQETLRTLQAVSFNSSYSFVYSERPHTSAVTAFSAEQQIATHSAQRRLAELQALQEEISLAENKKILGSTVEVLVEGPSKHISSLMRGRIPQNTLMELTGTLPMAGSLVLAAVEHVSAHGLRGKTCPR